MNLGIFQICIFISSLYLHGEEYDDKELEQIGTDAFRIRKEAPYNEKISSFRNAFGGLDDSQKIKALTLSLFEKEVTRPMSLHTASTHLRVLSHDKGLISDYSELRKMLKTETDSRRFFLLSLLAPWPTEDEKHDFVPERAHMLFGHGAVTRTDSEYVTDYSHDVTVYTYQVIVACLKRLGADFEPPSDETPHKERVLILAKWLKENWKGCENLKISGVREKNHRKNPSVLEKNQLENLT